MKPPVTDEEFLKVFALIVSMLEDIRTALQDLKESGEKYKWGMP